MEATESEATVRFEVHDGCPPPVNARQSTPDWFKKLPAFMNDTGTSPSVKMCRPFGDAMRLGTHIRAPVDIHLDVTDDGIKIINDELREYLTLYDAYQPPVEGNSRFLLPDGKFELPVYWETATEYLTFITEPKNFPFPEMESFSLLVDAGSTPRQVVLPVVFESQRIRLDAGTPIAHVWFMRRDRIITEMETHLIDDFPGVKQLHEELCNLISGKGDMYRAHYWKPKDYPTYNRGMADTAVLADSTARTGNDFEDMVEDTDTRPFRLYAYAKNYDLVPEPVRNETYIPPHYQNLTEFIDDDEHGEMLQSQITNAMRLGVIVPQVADLHITQDEDGASVESKFDQSTMHEMMADRMGGNPLGHTEPVNIHAKWLSHTPDGYSNYYLRPANHMQDKYRAFNGIVEDEEWIDRANAPGMLRTPSENFTLPRGMPVVELLPFHRGDFGQIIEVTTYE
jgi:hypothetical protein